MTLLLADKENTRAMNHFKKNKNVGFSAHAPTVKNYFLNCRLQTSVDT